MILKSKPLPPSSLRQQLLEGCQNPLASYVRSQNASCIVHHAAHPAKAIHLPSAQPISALVPFNSCRLTLSCLLVVAPAAQTLHITSMESCMPAPASRQPLQHMSPCHTEHSSSCKTSAWEKVPAGPRAGAPWVGSPCRLPGRRTLPGCAGTALLRWQPLRAL